MSITLALTAKGRLTLRREVREHLGARPGDKVEVDLLPNGRIQLKAKKTVPISDVFGMMAEPAAPPGSIEELNEAIAAGGAGEIGASRTGGVRVLLKVTPKRQVTLPAHVLDALRAKPGDRLLLEETPAGYRLCPGRNDAEGLAPLRHKIRRGRGSFDIHAFRDQARDPSLRD